VRRLVESDFDLEPLTGPAQLSSNDSDPHDSGLALNTDIQTLNSKLLVSAIPLVLKPRLEALVYFGVDDSAVIA
jgi:hypothetical protein